MTHSDITHALQLHFEADFNQDSFDFYRDFITHMPFIESIGSFAIGLDTNAKIKTLEPGSNITFIKFSEEPFIKEQINEYIDNDEAMESIIGYTWLHDILIISFDF